MMNGWMTRDGMREFDPEGFERIEAKTFIEELAIPLARNADPQSAHEAAKLVKAGSTELKRLILLTVEVYGPMTAFEIAARLSGRRWQPDSIRTEVSRTLVKTGTYAKHNGRRYAIYGAPCPT